jgi:hypothetical protein
MYVNHFEPLTQLLLELFEGFQGTPRLAGAHTSVELKCRNASIFVIF